MKITRYPLKATAIVPGRDAGLGIRMQPEGEKPRGNAAIRVYVDGVDSGLLPDDVAELYLGPEEGCLVRLDHNGANPVGAGEFESGAINNCVDTQIVYDEGATIGTLPACSSTMDITVECAPSDPEDSGSPLIPWLIVRNAGLEIIASRPLDDVLPPIPLTINGVSVGTVSRCSDGVEVNVTGECVLVNETCTGSGTVGVDDGQGGVYSAGVGC